MATASQSIRQIIAQQASAAAVLQRFEIDLTSQCDQSLTHACAELQLSIDQVLEKLAAAEAYDTGALEADPATIPLQKLIQHIVRLHHRSVRQELPRLAMMAHRLSAELGRQAPLPTEIQRLVDELHRNILAHIEKEEQVLFPYIAYLDQPPGMPAPHIGRRFHRVSQPVGMMINDHESVSMILGELKTLTNGFRAPAEAGESYISLCAALRIFEEHFQHHVHLENDILFPRAVELEDRISSSTHG